MSDRKFFVVIGVTAAVFLLDWFYVAYITSHGFTVKTSEFVLGSLNFSLPLQWLPVIGVVLVSLTVWYEVTAAIFPRRSALESDQLSDLRLVRVVAISLAAFICVLYIPYIIGSDWFWAVMSSLSSISQVRDSALSLLNTDKPMMELNPLWQYSISQASALMIMILSASIFGRGTRRVRR
ncbi:MAG TPA: hypothetical protein VK503_03535 [Candidatus Bathyarchaeia archaeon]|nr:hypothetical protein [Candidatus Bathyarchaeia archaeon]